MRANMSAKEEEQLTDEEVVAQVRASPCVIVYLSPLTSRKSTFSNRSRESVLRPAQKLIIQPEADIFCMVHSSFVFAATDTTSSALSRALCLLAEHPTIQDRLREEVLNAKRNCEAGEEGDLNYDEMEALEFLDAICRETMRLWVFHSLFVDFRLWDIYCVITQVSPSPVHRPNVSVPHYLHSFA